MDVNTVEQIAQRFVTPWRTSTTMAGQCAFCGCFCPHRKYAKILGIQARYGQTPHANGSTIDFLGRLCVRGGALRLFGNSCCNAQLSLPRLPASRWLRLLADRNYSQGSVSACEWRAAISGKYRRQRQRRTPRVLREMRIAPVRFDLRPSRNAGNSSRQP